MILFELTENENHPIYQELEAANGARQYDFLRSIVSAALRSERGFLSQQVIKALNHQAIVCLHTNPGEYRPCPVHVGKYIPPQHFRVPALMDDFTNIVNRLWEKTDAVVLASFVLWRLNNIHPFINGNGRTARAACYFVLCVKAGGWLPGENILPELLRKNRDEYVAALKHADENFPSQSIDALQPLHQLITNLLEQQLPKPNSAKEPEPPIPS